MAVIALLVKTSSPGPIFFSQWRVGERGKLFRIIKFRTMVVNAEQLHHQVMGHQTGLHKLKNDPRVTPVGRWLRKLSLDELPQLWNVLRGEMSLVGPRPWALYDAVRIGVAQRQRLNALPGITGAWQVNGRSHLLDLHLVNSCDLHYLRTWSLWQDLKFLMLTIPKVLTGFGAY
jgi:lipopolysaccharide/colanic/teichoic acid biosynthesis glycosyltransferase